MFISDSVVWICANLSKICKGCQKVHVCDTFVGLYSSTWKRFQNRCE